jgi:protein-tyrosine phosphatase
LIELHFHCLPGIDDGPANWDEAIALCRAAAAEGTHTIAATPHVLRDAWMNERQPDRDDLLMRLNDLLGGSPAIVPGCEYFFSSDAVELWEQGERGPLTGLNRSRYLLVEFPATILPTNAEGVFHELSLIDVVPVIAHPERHLVFSRQPEKLARLVQLGAITQITAGSITGSFGKAAQAASAEFMRRGLVHIVASDAHSTTRRPPQLAEARERVRNTWGPEAEADLFELNPRAVIDDEPLPSVSAPRSFVRNSR